MVSTPLVHKGFATLARMAKTLPDSLSGAQVDPDDLLELLPDWQIHLKARNVSDATIDSYLRVSRTFYAFLQSNGMPLRARHITRDNVETYLASMFERKARNRSGLIPTGDGGEALPLAAAALPVVGR